MRRFALILAAIFGVAVLFYGAVWLWAWSRLESQIERAIARHEAAGGEFSASRLAIGGFPFSLGAAADDVVLVQPDGVVWRTPSLSARSEVWSPDRIDITAEGGVEMTAPAVGGLGELAAVSAGGSGVIDHDFGASPAMMRLRFEDVELHPPQGPAITADAAVVTVVGADPQGGPASDISVGIDAESVGLPQAARLGLGGDIDELGITLSLVGPLPPDFHESAMALWRDAGGQLRVDRLHLLWDELAVSGEGTVQLDAALQPLVRLETEVRGLSQTLATLTGSGLLSIGQAAAIGLGFGMLGGAAGEGGGTPLAIAIADRRLTVGDMTLPGRLPRVEWPEAPPPAAIN